MKNDKLFLYLEGDMSPQEKSSFEEELRTNSELKEQYDKMKSFSSEMKSLALSEPETGYFNNVVPNFRNRLEKPKKAVFTIKYAAISFSVVVLAAASLLMFDFSGNPADSMEAITKEMSVDEIAQVIQTIEKETPSLKTGTINENDIDEQKVDEMIYSEIEISDESVNDKLSTYDYASLISSVDEQEADAVYNELINKDFLAKDK